jgi:amidase
VHEIWQLGAVTLAHRIARKEVSAREAVEFVLARIEAVNGTVNAIPRVYGEAARAMAGAADERLMRGEPLGPLCARWCRRMPSAPWS